ncbi:interferon receptor 2 [Striga asiatica]|uniref:Interferon receptor 2 n=1 Tax=Striga asiatica TaxID=4170 RepID=A0A5A7R3C6_STRAF|nr:interferon receptor 2 [Striga asiatica]
MLMSRRKIFNSRRHLHPPHHILIPLASRPTALRHSTATSVFSGHPNGTVALLDAVWSSPGLIHEGRNRQRHRWPPAASPSSARPGPRGAMITDLRFPDNTDNASATISRPSRHHRRLPLSLPPPSSIVVLCRVLDDTDQKIKYMDSKIQKPAL